MASLTRIDWIAIPNGLAELHGRKSWQLSVVVNPTFTVGAETGPAFPFVNWIRTLQQGNGKFNVTVSTLADPIATSIDLQHFDPNLWDAAFGLPSLAARKVDAGADAQARKILRTRIERALDDRRNVPKYSYPSEAWHEQVKQEFQLYLGVASGVQSAMSPLFPHSGAQKLTEIEQLKWFNFDPNRSRKIPFQIPIATKRPDLLERLIARFASDPSELDPDLIDPVITSIHNEAVNHQPVSPDSISFRDLLARVVALHTRVRPLGSAHIDKDLRTEESARGILADDNSPSFSERLLAMRQYLGLLRPLGLVLDLQGIDLSTLTSDQPILISIQPSGWMVPDVDNHFPTTKVQDPRQNFLLADPPPTVSGMPPLISNGMLNPQRIHTKNLDLVGIAHRFVGLAATLQKRSKVPASTYTSRFAANDPQPDRPPTLRSTGITIYLHHRQQQAIDDGTRASDISTMRDGDTAYTSSDLRQGFLVFARIKSRRDGSHSDWMSLCDRLATYILGKSAAQMQLAPIHESVPVKFVPTRPTDKTIYQASPPESRELPEDVLTIEQHHLGSDEGLSPVKNSDFQKDNSASSTQKEYHQVTLSTKAEGKVLAKRFGYTYELCFPAVSLAGTSQWDLKSIKSAGSELPSVEHTLLRYEPIPPPLVLAEASFQEQAGESLKRIVLRDGNGQNIRWLIPPKVDFDFAQWHGVFDWLIGSERDAEGFDGIRFNQETGEFLQTKEGVPYYASPGAPGSTYYPDPMAKRIYAEVLDSLAPFTITLQCGSGLTQAATEITLSDLPGSGSFTVSVDTNPPLCKDLPPLPDLTRLSVRADTTRERPMVEVSINMSGAPWGCFGSGIIIVAGSQTVRLPVIVSLGNGNPGSAKNYLYRFQEFRPARIPLYSEDGSWPTNLAPPKLSLIGAGGAVTTFVDQVGTNLTVSIPPGHNATLNLRCIFAALPRNARERAAHDVNAHGLASWVNSDLDVVTEGLNDVITPAEQLVVTYAVKQPTVFEFSYLSVYRTAGQSKVKFRAEFIVDYKSTGTILITATWVDPIINPESSDGIDPIRGAGKVHVGGKTVCRALGASAGPFFYDDCFNLVDQGSLKHRILTVTASGETAFRDCYPKTNNEKDQQQYVKLSTVTNVHLMHTGTPKSCSLLYSIPVFEHEYSTDGKIATQKHRGSVIRLWFDDADLFCTGTDELYGLIVCPSQMKSDNCDSVSPTSKLVQILPFLTRFGSDPITTAQKMNRAILTIADFDEVVESNDSVALQELKSAPGTPSNVAVVGYRPTFREAFTGMGLWFVDVVLKSAPTFNTFVRLMIVRYQPNSAPGCHISPIQAIHFAQLLNERSITVQRLPHRQLAVKVSGLPNPGGGVALGNTIEVFVEKKVGNGPVRWVTDKEALVSPTGEQQESADSEILWSGTIAFQDNFHSSAGPRRIVVKETRHTPRPFGTCNTIGTTVEWASGQTWTPSLLNKEALIDGARVKITAVNTGSDGAVKSLTVSGQTHSGSGQAFQLVQEAIVFQAVEKGEDLF